MPAAQSTYAEAQAAGFAGMVANSETQNRITRTASGNISFGQPVIRVGNHNCILASLETLEGAGAANATFAPAGATIGAITISAGAKEGVYHATAITAGATGKWQIEDPDGVAVGIATTGSVFTGGGLSFTITDSGTDPAVGEMFDITVTPSVGTADLDVLGISIAQKGLDHTTVDRYEQYDNVAILTTGVIWVTAGATVAAGDPVYWIVASGKYTNVAGAGNLRLTGWVFDLAGADAGLTKIVRR